MASQIAQLIVPADGHGDPIWILPDWTRGKIYFVSNPVLRSYRSIMETQTPLLSSTAYASFIQAVGLDPVTGSLLVNRPSEGSGITNGEPIYKLDPDTFAVTGTFGATVSIPSWPDSIWIQEAVIGVGCGTLASGGAVQVGYAVCKMTISSGNVSVIRTDTMKQAGFNQNVVSGSTNNHAVICRGASGAGGASVFLSWPQSTPSTPTVPLYTVAITPGAETYDPTSWPATKPHITSRTVGTIAAASVDPTWTKLACFSIGYDTADGNVVMDLFTDDAVAQQRYLVKVNASTAAKIWAAPVPHTPIIVATGLSGCDISHSIVAGIGPAAYVQINSGSGALTSTPFGGVNTGSRFFQVDTQGSVGSISSDTVALFLVGVQTFDGTATNAPVPVAGTPMSFTDGYALIGGLIPPPSGGGGGGGGGLRLAMDNVSVTAQQTLLSINLIGLRWSDDRGHSWSSPVTQSIGEAGEYRTSLQWQRLAYARDRCFEISWSVPMRTALQGCWVDVTPAQS